ncbi:hypothetical protein PR048_019956 [Dryococelus australis]|uniref:Uncharacterized protein n=1 Tax=Dryococelus australis TaxID=614101 RepID=A0ABQ9H4X1_9NEOP|nr:hypothetical protein PR048_019956 [Dryococelus australis]
MPPKRKMLCVTASNKLQLIRDIESAESFSDVSKDSGEPLSTVYTIWNPIEPMDTGNTNNYELENSSN